MTWNFYRLGWELDSFLQKKIEHSNSAMLVMDSQGIILAANPQAVSLFNQPIESLLKTPVWKQLNLHHFNCRRFLAKARAILKHCEPNIPEEMNCQETQEGIPRISFNVTFCKAEYQSNTIYYTKIKDTLLQKQTEWLLCALHNISHYFSINETIDEVLKLVIKYYQADYICVALLNNDQLQTISLLDSEEKLANLPLQFHGTLYEKAALSKEISFCPAAASQHFPQDALIDQYKINSALICPLLGQNDTVLGVFSLMYVEPLDKSLSDFKLLQIFIRRIVLEVEKYLQHKDINLFASIPKHNPNPIIRVLKNGQVLYANEAGRCLLKDWQRIDDKMRARLLELINEVQESDLELTEKINFNGHTFLINLKWVSEYQQVFIYGTNITQLEKARASILNLAHYDALTQIPNRQYFEEKLSFFLQQHEQEDQPFSLLLLDFDDFKIINDNLGHPVGDQFLIAASERIKSSLYKDDFFARLGGDEFVILLPNTDREKSTLVAEKIINLIESPFQIANHQIENTCSIGIAIFPDAGMNETELLKNADIAMYQAKKNGKNNVAIFGGEQPEVANIARINFRKELIKAVRNNEFFLCYQPYFQLETNHLAGFEAFMRWQHPTRGLIYPAEFISIAEKTGIITTAGQWGIDEALEEYSSALSIIKNLTLTLNISILQFNDDRFVDMLFDRIQYYNMEPGQIILDISEDLIDSKHHEVIDALKRIEAQGFKISIDNFGNPYSSLLKLTEMKIDYLKLNGEYIKDIKRFGPKYHLLEGIKQMAENLGIRALQKGVETQEQDLILRALNWDYVQGNYYCPPIVFDEIIPFIKQHHEKI